MCALAGARTHTHAHGLCYMEDGGQRDLLFSYVSLELCLTFFVGSGDPNSSHHAFTAHALSTAFTELLKTSDFCMGLHLVTPTKWNLDTDSLGHTPRTDPKFHNTPSSYFPEHTAPVIFRYST